MNDILQKLQVLEKINKKLESISLKVESIEEKLDLLIVNSIPINQPISQ